MKMKIYIGNIQRESSENEIKDLFETHGKVDSINLIRDNYTKMLKGFGFIEMNDENEAQTAIKNLDGQLFNGRPLSVNVAREKSPDNQRRRNFR
ncbi:MAG: RNA-binding protein [Ignavibacteria bacterium]|nr:RNA-binding protein [Ignavibacteria bacterium]